MRRVAIQEVGKMVEISLSGKKSTVLDMSSSWPKDIQLEVSMKRFWNNVSVKLGQLPFSQFLLPSRSRQNQELYVKCLLHQVMSGSPQGIFFPPQGIFLTSSWTYLSAAITLWHPPFSSLASALSLISTVQLNTWRVFHLCHSYVSPVKV